MTRDPYIAEAAERAAKVCDERELAIAAVWYRDGVFDTEAHIIAHAATLREYWTPPVDPVDVVVFELMKAAGYRYDNIDHAKQMYPSGFNEYRNAVLAGVEIGKGMGK